jgi:hypothetical protein
MSVAAQPKNGITVLVKFSCQYTAPFAWSRVVIEKCRVAQLVRKYPVFCEICYYIHKRPPLYLIMSWMAQVHVLSIEELHNLYSSPSIIRMIKSRRLRWAKHVA